MRTHTQLVCAVPDLCLPPVTLPSNSLQVLEMSDPNQGYNAATGQFTDMVKAGVIDPLKVRGHWSG
jgi:hypothetical protein